MGKRNMSDITWTLGRKKRKEKNRKRKYPSLRIYNHCSFMGLGFKFTLTILSQKTPNSKINL